MKDQITHLYSAYKQGSTSRRDFLRKLVLYAGSTAAASVLLTLLENNDLKAVNDPVNNGDPVNDEIFSETISYPGETGQINAFIARPEKKKKLPAVIIIHEIFGLNAHIRDVTKRMAKEGFLALAPDALTPLGGSPEDRDKARTMIGGLNHEQTVKNLVAAVQYLETHPLSNGKVGCTGFCWGGAMTNNVAVNAPTLDAAVPYYGRQPAVEDVPKIKAAVLAHYAGDDPGINAGITAFEEALKKAGIEYRIFIYDGAKHAFNNDTNPERFNKKAADLAWTRTVSFFHDKLI
jgi:carboxymethylenebutenolidase